MAREMGAEFGCPQRLGKNDIVLHYSTLGAPQHPSRTISLCWELYPEMKLRGLGGDRSKLRKIKRSTSARWVTVPTTYSQAFYPRSVEILPIGVDTSLFAPSADRLAARARFGWGDGEKIAVWAGADHLMKGPDLRDEWARANPDWTVITVRKEQPISQQELADLLSAADTFLSTSRLVPLFMVEWEALASGVSLTLAGDVPREFQPWIRDGRDLVFRLGWDRPTALETWSHFIDRCLWEGK